MPDTDANTDANTNANASVSSTQPSDSSTTPRFAPPVLPPFQDLYIQVYLGGFEAHGTYFDLWYSLYQGAEAVASVDAVHSNPDDVTNEWERKVHERAAFWLVHGTYDSLPCWRPGAKQALEEADRRVRARRLPLYYEKE